MCLHGAFMALCMFTRLLLMRRNAKKRGDGTSDGSSPDENVSLVLDLGGHVNTDDASSSGCRGDPAQERFRGFDGQAEPRLPLCLLVVESRWKRGSEMSFVADVMKHVEHHCLASSCWYGGYGNDRSRQGRKYGKCLTWTRRQSQRCTTFVERTPFKC